MRPLFPPPPPVPPHSLVPIFTNTIFRYDLSRTYCVIFAGICGLTVKLKVNGKCHLRYPLDSRYARVSIVLSAYTELKDAFGPRINFCTIRSPSLADYFHYFNLSDPTPDYVKSEQSALEEEIIHINQGLISLNHGILTNINLANRCLVYSKNKCQRSCTKIVYRSVRKICLIRVDIRRLSFHPTPQHLIQADPQHSHP